MRLRPLDHMEWLPGQWAFLSDPARFKLARWGNQWGGKTWAGIAEVIWRCLGYHPLLGDGGKVHEPPIEAWIVCASWSQSLAIQKKIWEQLPKDEIDPRTRFEPGRGFGSISPHVKFRNGSVIYIKTSGQDAINMSAATIHVLMFDEPPKRERNFQEGISRLRKTGGVLICTMTPINAPVDYIKRMVDEGLISDNHYRLIPENLIPVGGTEPFQTGDGRPMDQVWIDEITAETLPHERPVVLDGEWEMRTVDSIFGQTFDPASPLLGHSPRQATASSVSRSTTGLATTTARARCYWLSSGSTENLGSGCSGATHRTQARAGTNTAA